MAQGSEIEEGSSVALDGDRSSREAPRGGYSPLPVTARPRSLALGSRTAALQRAVARPFQRRATAQIGPLRGEVTASARGATARFPRQMHGRLGARFACGADPGVRLGQGMVLVAVATTARDAASPGQVARGDPLPEVSGLLRYRGGDPREHSRGDRSAIGALSLWRSPRRCVRPRRAPPRGNRTRTPPATSG
jgi:hypothetical protein